MSAPRMNHNTTTLAAEVAKLRSLRRVAQRFTDISSKFEKLREDQQALDAILTKAEKISESDSYDNEEISSLMETVGSRRRDLEERQRVLNEELEKVYVEENVTIDADENVVIG